MFYVFFVGFYYLKVCVSLVCSRFFVDLDSIPSFICNCLYHFNAYWLPLIQRERNLCSFDCLFVYYPRFLCHNCFSIENYCAKRTANNKIRTNVVNREKNKKKLANKQNVYLE